MIAIYCFYNISNGIQSRLAFSKEFKHCNIITFDGDYWINYELDCYGVHTKVLQVKDGAKLLRSLRILKPLIATVTVFVDYPVKVTWKPFWVRSCNEFTRYVGGVDIGLTLNPMHLYKKLLQYGEASNYQILNAWRRTEWDSSMAAEAAITTPTI